MITPPHTRTRALERLALILSAETDPHLAAANVAEAACAELPADSAEILIADAGGTMLRPLAAFGMQASIAQSVSSGSLAGVAFAQRNTVLGGETGERPMDPELAAKGIVSALSTPIQRGERRLGVLSVHTRELRRFGGHDIRFAERLAALMAPLLNELALQAQQQALQLRERAPQRDDPASDRQGELIALSTVVQDAAHTARNIFNAIGMNAELSRRFVQRGEVERPVEMLGHVNSNCDRGSRLVSDITALLPPRQPAEKVELRELLQQVSTRLRKLPQAPGIDTSLLDPAEGFTLNRTLFCYLLLEVGKHLLHRSPQRLLLETQSTADHAFFRFQASGCAPLPAPDPDAPPKPEPLRYVKRVFEACKGSLTLDEEPDETIASIKLSRRYRMPD